MPVAAVAVEHGDHDNLITVLHKVKTVWALSTTPLLLLICNVNVLVLQGRSTLMQSHL